MALSQNSSSGQESGASFAQSLPGGCEFISAANRDSGASKSLTCGHNESQPATAWTQVVAYRHGTMTVTVERNGADYRLIFDNVDTGEYSTRPLAARDDATAKGLAAVFCATKA